MKLFIILLILLITSNAFAISMEVPFRCYKQTLIKEFAKEGIILDEDDENADGFIENRGDSYIIHLYEYPESFEIYKEIPLKVQRMKWKSKQLNTGN